MAIGDELDVAEVFVNVFRAENFIEQLQLEFTRYPHISRRYTSNFPRRESPSSPLDRENRLASRPRVYTGLIITHRRQTYPTSSLNFALPPPYIISNVRRLLYLLPILYLTAATVRWWRRGGGRIASSTYR